MPTVHPLRQGCGTTLQSRASRSASTICTCPVPPAHICTRTRPTLPHLRRDSAHPAASTRPGALFPLCPFASTLLHGRPPPPPATKSRLEYAESPLALQCAIAGVEAIARILDLSECAIEALDLEGNDLSMLGNRPMHAKTNAAAAAFMRAGNDRGSMTSRERDDYDGALDELARSDGSALLELLGRCWRASDAVRACVRTCEGLGPARRTWRAPTQ